MIISEKFKRLLCKFLGHKFGGYEIPDMQRLPENFYCARCRKMVSIDKGWI